MLIDDMISGTGTFVGIGIVERFPIPGSFIMGLLLLGFSVCFGWMLAVLSISSVIIWIIFMCFPIVLSMYT